MEEKQCTKCGKILSLECFGTRKGKYRKEGDRHAQCKSCTAKHRRFRYHTETGFAKKASLISKANYLKARKEALEHYGNKCNCCGETAPEFLSFDHINGRINGQKRKDGFSGKRFVQWLKKSGYPKDIQILCYNCNCAKGFYGICPHQKQSQEPARNEQVLFSVATR